ncbi:MAG: hemerythrin family protein [Firmicutes bacterium]|nr:hemerythrin family protein [Bacillota bacterium]
MVMQWRDDLATGVELIDSQHQELIARVNRLLTACHEGRGKAEVADIVDFLGHYVVTHFRDEEELQRSVAYPEYDAHKTMHEKFLADYNQLKGQLETEGATVRLVVLVNKVVVDWLVHHISRVDKAFAAYYREQTSNKR